MTANVADRFTQLLGRAARRLGMVGEDGLITLARRFGIAGFVARHFYGDSSEGYREETRARRLFESVMLKQAADVSAVLTARGVTHFFLKGVVVSRWLYEPGERHFVDIDLCIPPEQRASAMDALATMTYAELPGETQGGPAALRPGVVLVRDLARTAMEAVNLDIRWGIEPIDRLLPRSDTPMPEAVWARLTRVGSLPSPDPAHHAALLLHHLVHHDLLHIRSLLDLTLLLQRLPADAGAEFEKVARRLGVLRAARAVSGALRRDLDLELDPGIGAESRDLRGRRLARILRLEEWLTWAGAAAGQEHVSVTPRRILRRTLLLDRIGSVRKLIADAVWPPSEFVRWRWPDAGSMGHARAKHLTSAIRKIAGV